MNRRTAIVSLASALLINATFVAHANVDAAFEQKAFEDAQAAGKSILLHVAATWCETCHAQREVLNKLETEGAFKDLVILTIDYDTQKDIMRSFGVTKRSTLIAFKGKTETGRVTGTTNAAKIKALMTQAL